MINKMRGFQLGLFVILFSLFGCGSYAQTPEESEKISNPFLTDEEVAAFGSQDQNITYIDPNISAIFCSPRSSTVVVSGRVLGVNDFIDNKQIIAIQPESVVLKDKKGTYVLKMGPVFQKQPALVAKKSD